METNWITGLGLIAGVIFTFLVTPYLLYLATCQWLQPTDKQCLPRWFALHLPFGPIVISVLLWGLYTFFPGHSDTFYLSSVGSTFAALLVVLVIQAKRQGVCYTTTMARSLRDQLRDGWQDKPQTIGVLLSGLALIALLCQLTVAVQHPIIGSDSAQYAMVANKGYTEARWDFYPLIEPDPVTQFADTSDHPPTYYMLKIWHYLLQSDGQHAGISKVIEPLMLTNLGVGLWAGLLPFGWVAAGLGGLLVFSVPALLGLSLYHSIDTFMIAAYTAASLWMLVDVLPNPTNKKLMISGLFGGLAMLTHNLIGLLMLPTLCLLYTAGLWKTITRPQWLSAAGWVALGALPFGCLGFVANLLTHGQAIGTSLPLLDTIDQIQYYVTRRIHVQMGTVTDSLLHGVFRQWSYLPYFGWVAWVATAIALTRWKAFWQHKTLRACAVIVLFFVLLLGISNLFARGRFCILAINPRYGLVTIGFFIIITAIGLQQLWAWCQHQQQRVIATLISSLMVIGSVGVAASTLWHQSAFIRDGYATVFGSPLETWKTHPTETTFQSLALVDKHVTPNLTPGEFMVSSAAEATIYYLGIPAINESGNQLLPFYNAANDKAAFNVLTDLGIRYVAYYPKVFHSLHGNTWWGPLLANPNVFTPIAQQGKMRLYQRVSDTYQPSQFFKPVQPSTLAKAVQSGNRTCYLWALTPDIPAEWATNGTPLLVSGLATGSVDMVLADLADTDPTHQQQLWHHIVPPGQQQVFYSQLALPKAMAQPALGLCPAKHTPAINIQTLQLAPTV